MKNDRQYKYLDHIHVLPNHKLVYVDTPKTGCSTIKMLLNRLIDPKYNPYVTSKYGYSSSLLGLHDRGQSLLKRVGTAADFDKILNEATHIVCFVRNPYSRILSAYLDKLCGNVDRREIHLASLRSKDCLNTSVEFKEFVQLVSRQKVGEMNAHWRLQTEHLAFGTIPYTFVGRFEQFGDDIKAVAKLVGGTFNTLDMTVDEHKTNANLRLAEYYDEESMRLIEKIYADDFKMFGYKKWSNNGSFDLDAN